MLAQVVVTRLSLNVSRGCLLFFTVLIPGFLHRERERKIDRRDTTFLIPAKLPKLL